MEVKTFDNKVAIVTGAGQGIGFEIAKRLAAEGAAIVLNDINPELAAKAEQEILSKGGACVAVAGDASEPEIIHDMVTTAVGHFSSLDIIVANAGITLFGDFFNYPAPSFYEVLKVNLGGTFFLAQAAAKQMVQQGSGGSLLFTSSVTGHQAHKNLAVYAMTKAALEMLAKNLVIEVSSYNINVNTIAPGATLTERTMEDSNYEKVWSSLTPLGHPASVSDIANAALFLVSDKAKHITGQSLIIDGGWTAISPSPF